MLNEINLFILTNSANNLTFNGMNSLNNTIARPQSASVYIF